MRLIIHALNYIYQDLDVDIVNMSFGVNICKEIDELYEICYKFHNKGVLLVSSFDNSGTISYPAVFDCVLGIRSGEMCYKTDDFEYVDV